MIRKDIVIVQHTNITHTKAEEKISIMILQNFCDLLHTATPFSNVNFLQDITKKFSLYIFLKYLLYRTK